MLEVSWSCILPKVIDSCITANVSFIPSSKSFISRSYLKVYFLYFCAFIWMYFQALYLYKQKKLLVTPTTQKVLFWQLKKTTVILPFKSNLNQVAFFSEVWTLFLVCTYFRKNKASIIQTEKLSVLVLLSKMTVYRRYFKNNLS